MDKPYSRASGKSLKRVSEKSLARTSEKAAPNASEKAVPRASGKALQRQRKPRAKKTKKNKPVKDQSSAKDQKSKKRKGEPLQEVPPSKKSKKWNVELFSSYLNEKQVSQGLENGSLHKGSLQIPSKRNQVAYVSVPGYARDFFIPDLTTRNRALNGDLVVISPLPTKKKPTITSDDEDVAISLATPVEKKMEQTEGEGCIPAVETTNIQQNATVVAITKRHSVLFAGTCSKQKKSDKKNTATFKPNDMRVPFIQVSSNAEIEPNFLYMAKLTHWSQKMYSPQGIIAKSLGPVGDINAEIQAQCLKYRVEDKKFSREALDCLPKLPWKITKEELKKRRDLRKDRVYSIDPATSKDRDDAMTCMPLPNGNYNVAVHIADVSHFVRPDTKLDQEVYERGTSVYLVGQVKNMIPELLSEDLCSLNANKERLAFSVGWELNSKGEIKSEWFSRTVIKSNIQFSYEQAQHILTEKSIPKDVRLNGLEAQTVVKDVLAMQEIAKNLRTRRYQQGCLSLNRKSLYVNSTKIHNGVPEINGFDIYELQDSNRLVEEFMLLANKSVARKLNMSYPSCTLLRSQEPPNLLSLGKLSLLAEDLGYKFKVNTSKELHESLENIDDPLTKEILSLQCTMTMRRAKYTCSSSDSEHYSRHYALNEDLYTHFTSPIRRYSDIVVHRLLNAILEKQDPPYQPIEMMKMANHFTEKSSEASSCENSVREIYMTFYFKQLSDPILTLPVIISTLKYNKEKGALFLEGYSSQWGIDRSIFLGEKDKDLQVSVVELTDSKKNLHSKKPLGKRNGVGIGPTYRILWKNGETLSETNVQLFQKITVTVVTDFQISPPSFKFILTPSDPKTKRKSSSGSKD